MIATTPSPDVEAAFRIAQEVLRRLAALPAELQEQVLEYAEILAPRPDAARGKGLPTFLDFNEEESRAVSAALFVSSSREEAR